MELNRAKEIVGTVMQWQFWLMGINGKPENELDKNISLQELIDANTEVVKWNKQQRELPRKEGETFSQHQTLADRLIAAVYVAMNFECNGEAVAVMNGVGVGCVIMKESE